MTMNRRIRRPIVMRLAIVLRPPQVGPPENPGAVQRISASESVQDYPARRRNPPPAADNRFADRGLLPSKPDESDPTQSVNEHDRTDGKARGKRIILSGEPGDHSAH